MKPPLIEPGFPFRQPWPDAASLGSSPRKNNNYTPTGVVVVVVVVVVVAVAEIRTVKETVHATGLQATPHPPVIVWFRFISIGDKYKTKKFNIQIRVTNRKPP